MKKRLTLFCSASLLVATAGTESALSNETGIDLPPPVARLLENQCFFCHDEDTQKGDIRLDQLGKLSLDARLDLLNKVQEQVFFEEMPPKKRKKQPTEAERASLVAWISGQLKEHNASKLEEKLEQAEFGNYVDHDKLFSGEYKDLPGFTRDRRWLISEFIFDAKVNQLIDHPGDRTIDGQKRTVIGDNGVNIGTRFGGGSLRQSITNPFLLPSNIGVRYYDTTSLTSGHLLTMISNAKKIAAYMSSEVAMKAHYPAMYRLMKMELAHRATLTSRERFLKNYIEHVAQEIYDEKNEALLPKFVRVEVDEVEIPLDSEGKPKPREDNMELLRGRYDAQDVQAIYRGIQSYKLDGVSYGEVVEKCEREWFNFGIHEKRLRGRVTLMKIIDKRWDMALIYEDVAKQNMALPPYQPLSDGEMQVITASILKHRRQGERYNEIIEKCMGDWEASFKVDRIAAGQADNQQIGDLADELFAKIYEREPTEKEKNENIALTRTYIQTLGNQQAIAKLIETLILSSELVYRSEFGQGEADEHGRRMMSPRDASYALAYALTDSSPDSELLAAVKEGRLSTRADYRREAIRMIKRRDQFYVIDEAVQKAGFNSSITNTPIRKLRFFREFFGYPKALTIFKDDARFGPGRYDNVKGRLVDEADTLVDHILKKDQNVIEELLTTEKFYVFHSGNNEAMKASSDRLRKIYDYFKVHDWENFTEEQLYQHWDFIDEMKMMGTVFPNFLKSKRKKDWVRSFQTLMRSYTLRFGKGQKAAAPYDAVAMAYWHKGEAATRTGTRMRGEEVGHFFNIDYANWDYPTTQPAKVGNRKGMLTHPAWLIAHSLNLENDPVRRGKWIREKLLAGTIPDVPITVDAVVPEDHHKTLRQRLEKTTGEQYCWKCHQRMDPLGLPFEIYDDFGRFRMLERLEHPDNLIKPAPKERGLHIDRRPTYKTLPVDSSGVLEGTDDQALDGEVKDGMELAERLAKSTRVRQSIIRHAFRYFLGRNEVLSDSKTLIDAEQAYLDSEGSFDAVIVSLLSSDSFIYRMPTEQPSHDN